MIYHFSCNIADVFNQIAVLPLCCMVVSNLIRRKGSDEQKTWQERFLNLSNIEREQPRQGTAIRNPD